MARGIQSHKSNESTSLVYVCDAFYEKITFSCIYIYTFIPRLVSDIFSRCL